MRVLSVIVSLCLMATSAFAQQNNQEWSIARDFLLSVGISTSNLQIEYSSDKLITFADEQNRVFAVVVSRKYQKYIDNPVVAWGNGDLLWKYSGMARYSPQDFMLLDWYESRLQALKDNDQVYSSPVNFQGNEQVIGPILGDIKYGQEQPYNMFFPTREIGGKITNCAVGCGPVALAQVLAYYHSDTKPSGTAAIETDTGEAYRVYLSDFTFSWSNSHEDLAKLMLCSAASVRAIVTPDASSSGLAFFKHALLNHWHYSPKCSYRQKGKDTETLSTICQEIDHNRPVILADSTHMYVCDGYYRDYVHLNLGWDGCCNGFYRALLSESDTEGLLPFNELLIGIRPMGDDETKSLMISVSQPGTLANHISKAQRDCITSLKVSGQIDGEDIAILRQMGQNGSLMELDLSDATIVRGGCYVTRSANGMVFSGTYKSGNTKLKYHYDMSNLKPGQFREMEARGITRKPTRLIRPQGKGYVVSWYSENATIGPYMFDGCDNLCRIVLPKSLKEVKENAFFGCFSLSKVEGLPPNTSSKAFNNTVLVKR